MTNKELQEELKKYPDDFVIEMSIECQDKSGDEYTHCKIPEKVTVINRHQEIILE